MGFVFLRSYVVFLGQPSRQRASNNMDTGTPFTPGEYTPVRDATPRGTTPRSTPQIDPSKLLPQLRQAFPGGMLKNPHMYNNLTAAVTNQSPQTSRGQYPQFGYTQQFPQQYQQPQYSR